VGYPQFCGARPRSAQVSRDDVADTPNADRKIGCSRSVMHLIAHRGVEEREISIDGSGKSLQE